MIRLPKNPKFVDPRETIPKSSEVTTSPTTAKSQTVTTGVDTSTLKRLINEVVSGHIDRVIDQEDEGKEELKDLAKVVRKLEKPKGDKEMMGLLQVVFLFHSYHYFFLQF